CHRAPFLRLQLELFPRDVRDGGLVAGPAALPVFQGPHLPGPPPRPLVDVRGLHDEDEDVVGGAALRPRRGAEQPGVFGPGLPALDLLVDASPQGSPEVEEGEDGLGRQVVLVEHVQRHGGVTATQRHDETMLDEPLERARGGGLGYAARPRDRAAAQWADRVRQRPDDGCVDVGDGDRVRTEEVHGAILADPAHPRSAWTGPGPRLGPCPRVGPCPRPGPCRGRTPVPAWAPRRAPAAGPYTRCGAVDRSWTGRTKIGPLPLEGSCLLVRGCPRWTRGARAARPSAPVEDDL